jgi:hypothetical protein
VAQTCVVSKVRKTSAISSAARGADADLIDEALAVVRDAQARAPRDFLLALSLALGCVAIALLAAAVLTGGLLQDLLVNLGA